MLRRRSASITSNLRDIREHIQRQWDALTRSTNGSGLFEAAVDPKTPKSKHTVYIPGCERLEDIVEAARKELPPEMFEQLDFLMLDDGLTVDPMVHGILYLPKPYVIPGGRFNEMYAFDSYFAVLGLIRDGRVAQAIDLTDNMVYQVMHYGTILNGNRSYYLKRSQPPLLTRSVLAVYAQTNDNAWLESTLPAINKFHTYWTIPPPLRRWEG